MVPIPQTYARDCPLAGVKYGTPIIMTGAAGTGKSWLASALGHQACMNGYKVVYFNLYRLFEEIALARVSGTLHRFFSKLAQTDLLIIDDFGINVLKKNTTAADAILDRIVHTDVRFDLKGESMRKEKSTKKSDVTEK